jgi:hypothetical protein
MNRRAFGLVIGTVAMATVVLAGLSGPVNAATTSYTDRATFEASLPAGYYVDNFSTVPDAFNSPVAQVAGQGGTPQVGFTITAPTSGLGVFPDSGFKAIGNWSSGQAVVVSFDANVFSGGADFWLSDINGVRQTGSITVDFAGGPQIVVPSTTAGTFGFAGVTADTPLTTMTIQPAAPFYLNMTNLTAATVPEPAAAVGLGVVAAGVGLFGLKRRQRSSRGS